VVAVEEKAGREACNRVNGGGNDIAVIGIIEWRVVMA
jgi:hypothetical protein